MQPCPWLVGLQPRTARAGAAVGSRPCRTRPLQRAQRTPSPWRPPARSAPAPRSASPAPRWAHPAAAPDGWVGWSGEGGGRSALWLLCRLQSAIYQGDICRACGPAPSDHIPARSLPGTAPSSASYPRLVQQRARQCQPLQLAAAQPAAAVAQPGGEALWQGLDEVQRLRHARRLDHLRRQAGQAAGLAWHAVRASTAQHAQPVLCGPAGPGRCWPVHPHR